MPEAPPPGRRPPARPTRMPPRPPARTPRKPGTAPPAGPVAPLDTAYRMVGPVVLGMAIGYFFIDQTFHTRPWGLLGMTLFGLITGFWSMLKPLYFPSEAAATRPVPGSAGSDSAAADPALLSEAPSTGETGAASKTGETSQTGERGDTGDNWERDAWKQDDWKQDDWDRKD